MERESIQPYLIPLQSCCVWTVASWLIYRFCMKTMRNSHSPKKNSIVWCDLKIFRFFRIEDLSVINEAHHNFLLICFGFLSYQHTSAIKFLFPSFLKLLWTSGIFLSMWQWYELYNSWINYDSYCKQKSLQKLTWKVN